MMQYPQISIPPRSQHLWRYTPWKRIHPTKVAEMPESDSIRFSSGVDSEMDDSEEIVRGRLKIYHKQTEPLVKYYQADSDNPEIGTKFIAIDGVGTLEEVKDRISTALSS